MDCNENKIDIVEIEGLLIDTRVSDDDRCKLCNGHFDNLAVLPCQHVFCRNCLSKPSMDGSGDSKPNKMTACPECQHNTKVGSNKLLASPSHHVATNHSNNSSVPETSAKCFCTNCDAGNRSTARCWTCQDNLCASCFIDHQRVALFKDHTVTRHNDANACDDRSESKEVTPKNFCDLHSNEVLQFFCVTCEISVCDKCVSAEHVAHYVCTRFKKKSPLQHDFDDLLEGANGSPCRNISAALKEALSGMEQQYDGAKKRIQEKYEHYKMNLERWREDSLRELDSLRTEQKSQLTEISENLKKIDNHMEDPCDLIVKLLRCENSLEVMSLKNSVKTRLLEVIDKPELAVDFNVKAENTPECESVEEVSGNNPTVSVSTENLSEDWNPQSDEEGTAKRGEIASSSKQGDSVSKAPFSPGRSNPKTSYKPLHYGKDITPKLQMDICLEFGRCGVKTGQFNSPKGLCLSNDGDIFVADSGNHRIQVFDKTGRFKYQFGGVHGMEDGQLNHPVKIASFKDSGKLVVADWAHYSSRLQLFTKNGAFIRKIVTKSAIVTIAGLAVTQTGGIVIVDKDKIEIVVINDNGVLLVKFCYEDRIVRPCDIDFWGNEFYVCDNMGHAVVVFGEDGVFKRRFKCKLRNHWHPGGLVVTNEGTILVGYSHMRRFNIIGFNRVGQELFFSRGPPPSMTTCCGLKLTSEGEVVAICKNEHVVIVAKIHYEKS